MSFRSPILLVLLVVPAIAAVAYILAQRRPPRTAVVFPNLAVLESVVERGSQWRRHLPAALILAAVAALAVGAARPSAVTVAAPRNSTVVLVVDVSGSMRATDVKPSRIEAAKAAMRTFVRSAPRGLRIGVIEFSTQPAVLSPPSVDHAEVLAAIDHATPGGRTAIGDAVDRAVTLARTTPDGQSLPSGPVSGFPPAAILLLSDGAQTSGLLTPDEAAGEARDEGIKIDTVALGTPNGVLLPGQNGGSGFQGGGFGGGNLNTGGDPIPVPPDPETLAQIAAATGGQTFTAQTADRLSSIYEKLGTSVKRTRRLEEFTWVALAAAIALLLGGAGLAVVRAPRLP